LLQQLATATRHGLPLAEVAAILATDHKTVPPGAPAAFAAALAAGEGVKAALAQAPAAAPPATLAWLALAEHQQQLPAALQAWGDDLAQLGSKQRALRLALLWPSAVAVVLLVLWFVLALFVMPAFAETFASFGTALPTISRVVFAASGAAGSAGWLPVVVAIVLAVLAGALWLGRLPPGLVRLAQRLTQRLGFVARWRAAVFGERLVRLLAAHPGHAPLQAAALAHLAAHTAGDPWAACARRLQAGLAAGQGLGAALQAETQLPRRLPAFVQLGEKSQQLPAALATLAEAAADETLEAQARLERGTILLLYQLLALTVGALVVAVYLPILSLGALV
jgi:type IV pilus assembly protein PilC